MAETQVSGMPEAVRSEVAALDSTPFQANESQADRAAKREAIYKKAFPPESETGQGTKIEDGASEQEQRAEPVEINWADPQDSEVSPEVAGVRQGIQGYFGELGLDSQQATSLVGIARRYRDMPLSDAEAFAKQHDAEEVLQKEWGDAFEANSRAIRVLIKEFERRFKHEDLDAAIENGLWLDPDVNRALLEVARRQDPIKGDLQAIRKELMTVNQGSPRWHELNRALEAGYKKLHGTGRA